MQASGASGAMRLGSLALWPALPPLVYILLLPVLERIAPGTIGWSTITLYDWQRIAQIGALIAGIAISVLLGKGREPDLGAVAWLSAIAVLGALSVAVNGVSWWDAAHEIALLMSLILAFWAVWRAFIDAPCEEREQVAKLCLGGSAILYAALFLWTNQDNLLDADFMDMPLAIMAFANVRHFSDYQALVLPFLIYLVGSECHGLMSRIAGWCWMFLFCMTFFYTGSRVLVLGQAVMHAGLWLLLRRHYLPTLRRHATAWLGGFLFFLFFSQLLPALMSAKASLVQTLLRSDLSLRDILWNLAAQNIWQHPWLGIGPGEFSRQLNNVAAAPHNSLLMLGVEWGIPVLALVVVAVGGIIVRSLGGLRDRVSAEPTGEGFAIACWLAFGALLLHSLVANVLVIPVSQTGLILAAGMACATTIGNTSPRPVSSAKFALLIGRVGYAVLVLMTVVSLSVFLACDIPLLPARNSAYLNCMKPTPFFSPRFWQQGWLIGACPELTATGWKAVAPATRIN
jgi:O-antigen ligase